MSWVQSDAVDAVWDVAIIGAGPAGAATAITLAKFGQRVLLIDEQISAKFKLGESLPPASIGMVKHFLGEPEGLEDQSLGLFKTAGNISLWATEQENITDFFFTSSGYGLCVERLAFDEALRSRAVAAGANLLKGVRFQSCERVTNHSFNWRLNLTSQAQSQQYHARYLVDCSGRRAVVAKMLGVPTVENNDQLFAYAQWFSLCSKDDDRYTRIEASPQGWWYTNRLPYTVGDECKRVVVFHTDKDLPVARMAACREGFKQLLNASLETGILLHTKGYQPSGAIRGAPANSQRLQEFCGDAWMAVGDAAQAYDPLSSQGIDKALRTASHAGHMIHYALTDCSEGSGELGIQNAYIDQYNQQQQQLWQTYLSQRNYYYGIQTRWSDQPFWQRRQQLVM